MTKRLETLFSLIPRCEVFADVGCDHGYIANAMLKNGKCDRAIISDVSAECLKKAENLLCENFSGRFTAIVSDGFEKLPNSDCALIAGMGGDIIADILLSAKSLPEKLVLQPMKNAERVRRTARSLGYRITRDYTFRDGKFYDVIVAERGSDEEYTEAEYVFGRDNLRERGDDFVSLIETKIAELVSAAEFATDKSRESIDKRITELKKAIK